MGEYKPLLSSLLHDVEGYKAEVYDDGKGNPTIGRGLNLNDPEVRKGFILRGIDPDQVIQRKALPREDELDEIHDSYVSNREPLIRGQVGEGVFDPLPPNKKAALMSMGYQSLNNLGPSLNGYLANDDHLGAMKEMILKTNKDQDPGTLVRRLKEAELYGGPLDFTSTFKTMSPEEKTSINELINKIDNPNTREEVLKRYGSYLEQPKNNPSFNKLNKLLNPNIPIKKP